MNAGLRIGLLGYGEVGQIFGADLAIVARQLSTYDVAFSDRSSPQYIKVLAQPNITRCVSAAELASQSDLIFSAVTAEQANAAAHSVCKHLLRDAWFVDLNSASPATKRQAAQQINKTGGRYVEASVMSPVPPTRLATPILIGGLHASGFLKLKNSIGLTDVSVFSDQYGPTSAAKMCRSIMVKGIEALLVESLVTARGYGVEKTVLNSLDDLLPGPDWPRLAKYMIGRTLEHGGRRAEEMREVAKTVNDASLPANMSLATVAVQDWAKTYPEFQNLEALDAILDALGAAALQSTKGNAA